MKRRRLKFNPIREDEQVRRLEKSSSNVIQSMMTDYLRLLKNSGDELSYDMERVLEDWIFFKTMRSIDADRGLSDQTTADLSEWVVSSLRALGDVVQMAPAPLQIDVLSEFQERMSNLPPSFRSPTTRSPNEMAHIIRATEEEIDDRAYSRRSKNMDRAIREGKRVTRAAKMLGYKRVGGEQEFGEGTDWKCLAPPPDIDKKCASAWGNDRKGRSLYAKEPDWWVDLGKYPQPRPKADLYPWLLLAKKHDVRGFPTYFAPHSREPVEAWLRSRAPSRKAIERKLPRFFKTIPSTYDFSDRPVPDFIRQAGGRHVDNEIEIRVMGRQNGWCFGSSHYASHLTEIVENDYHLYFIPHPEGTIAVYGQFQEPEVLRQSKRVDYLPTEFGSFRLDEAKFPQNEEAIPTVKGMVSAYQKQIQEEARLLEEEEAELQALEESGSRSSSRYKGRRSQTRQRLRAARRRR